MRENFMYGLMGGDWKRNCEQQPPRQPSTLPVQFMAFWHYWRGIKSWGKMERKGFGAPGAA